MKKSLLLTVLFGAVAFVASAQNMELIGAGGTLAQPLYVRMFDHYLKDTGVKVNYQGVGSGAGINQLIAKTVDFGSSDAPMNADQIAKAGSEVLHIPTCVAAIVMTYNLPGFHHKIRLTGSVIADIYMAKILKWNDSAIQELNPGFKMPDSNIIVVRRSDASGTSYNFTGYLTKESPEWASSIGQSLNPKWPVGMGGKGNPGVAGYVRQVPGSIGYVEISYAQENHMPTAEIKNKSGNWIDPDKLVTLQDAADFPFPENGQADLIDSPAKNGYPISTTTFLLLYKDQTYTGNMEKSKAVVKALWWVLHQGQQYNESLAYAKLPKGAVDVADKLLQSVTYNGQPLLQ